jgi:hypothetical protein
MPSAQATLLANKVDDIEPEYHSVDVWQQIMLSAEEGRMNESFIPSKRSLKPSKLVRFVLMALNNVTS